MKIQHALIFCALKYMLYCVAYKHVLRPLKCFLFQFCLALRYYATGSFYSAIGDTQGVHKSTVCRSVYDVTNFLYDTSETYIKFPRWDEFALYAQDFAAMHGFPCVIGCIDGTHIAIQSPSGDERNFVNRKGYHSLNVMVRITSFPFPVQILPMQAKIFLYLKKMLIGTVLIIFR